MQHTTREGMNNLASQEQTPKIDGNDNFAGRDGAALSGLKTGCYLRIAVPTFANYVDNNSTPTIASNLLEANAVRSWRASCQRAKRFRLLLCTTIGHAPACYARQCLLSATYHAGE